MGHAFLAARFSPAAFSARMMVSKTAMRGPVPVSGLHNGPRPPFGFGALQHLFRRHQILAVFLVALPVACCTCQRVSGWLSSFLNRCRCSFLLMWKKSFNGNYGQNELFHNDGNGRFTEVPTKAGLTDARFSLSVWYDNNNDGYLDLHSGNYVKCQRIIQETDKST
jgi:hypothetical protein